MKTANTSKDALQQESGRSTYRYLTLLLCFNAKLGLKIKNKKKPSPLTIFVVSTLETVRAACHAWHVLCSKKTVSSCARTEAAEATCWWHCRLPQQVQSRMREARRDPEAGCNSSSSLAVVQPQPGLSTECGSGLLRNLKSHRKISFTWQTCSRVVFL